MIILEKLLAQFDYKIIDKDGYPYIILPFDYECDPMQINAFADALENVIRKNVDSEKIDKIVTIESKGILISTIVAMRFKRPINIIRKRELFLDKEIKIVKQTGYEESYCYINGIEEGMNIILIDDLISTGGTLTATMDTMLKLKCNILGIFIVFDKVDFGGSEKILKEYSEKYDIPFITLIKLRITDDKKLVLVNDNP
jgi:adenine phosphoribosyltransferase